MKINDCEMFLRSKTFPDFTCRYLYVHTDIHTAKLTPACRPACLPSLRLKERDQAAQPSREAWAMGEMSALPASTPAPAPFRPPRAHEAMQPAVQTTCEHLEREGRAET